MLHLCESLAQKGFVVAAPDFAEALSGAVATDVGRQEVMDALVQRLREEFQVERLGLVGHSAGAALAGRYQPHGATVFGRVALAGLAPGSQDLLEAMGMAPQGPDALDASAPRAALLFAQPLKGSRPPCHISFLAEQTNEAMISLLSPLLPVAQILKARRFSELRS